MARDTPLSPVRLRHQAGNSAMSYHYLFTDDERQVIARVRYCYQEDDSLHIEESIPAGFVPDASQKLELELNAIKLDKVHDEAPKPEKFEFATGHRIRWGARG